MKISQRDLAEILVEKLVETMDPQDIIAEWADREVEFWGRHADEETLEETAIDLGIVEEGELEII